MQRKHHVLQFVLMLSLMLLCLSTGVHAEGTYPQDIRPVPTEDLMGKIVILHSNDVHGAIEGYAKMAALRKAYEALGAEVILADAGDFSQGSPYVNVSSGVDAITMMNAAGYTVAGLGNHEFDFGYDKLRENLEKAEFKVICANIYENGAPIAAPHYLYEAKSGLKIGFLGLDTQESQTKANPSKIIGLTFYGGSDMYRIAEEEAKALRDEGADIVIAITHLGVDEESAAGGNRSIDLVKNTTGIDAIFDGHSHTVMTGDGENDLIQSTGTKFENIGVLVIGEDGKAEDHYLVATDQIAADESSAAYAAAKEIQARIDEEYGVKIGESEVAFEADKSANRTGETNSGDLIVDAMRWYFLEDPSMLEVPEDHLVAIINGGSIRAAIPAGEVTKEDVNTVYPFTNSLVVRYVTGEDLLEALEASTFCTPEPIGGYPQTGGITMTLDTTKEYDKGDQYPGSSYYSPASIQRVSIESINGKPFDPNDTYAVAMNDFMAAGGDTYFAFAMTEGIETGVLFDELLIDYITNELGGVLSAEKYGTARKEQTIILAENGDAAQDEVASSEGAGETGASDQSGDAPAAEAGAAAGDTYTVERGDCLSNIAEKLYGDGTKWTLLYENNRDIIKRPGLILPGQVLKLPDAA